MNIKVKIKGTDEVIKNLDSFNNHIEKEVEKEIINTATKVQARAKQRCPVDTGSLRNSISIKKLDDMEVEVGAYMPYAAYVEFGTYKMKARPYLFPAFEEERPKFLRRLEKIMGSDMK